MTLSFLKCEGCGAEMDDASYPIDCYFCGGLLEACYQQWGIANFIDHDQRSIFRFHRVMPFSPQCQTERPIETFEPTPLIHAPTLSAQLGIELYFKDETGLPTGTWKDREGFVSIDRLVRNGVDDLVVFSSGNTGVALARGAGLCRGPRVHVVAPSSSMQRLSSLSAFDGTFARLRFFDGGNVECIAQAATWARTQSFRVEGGFRNYARREGLKLLALELLTQSRVHFDWYVQSVAGGIGIYSFLKAFRDLRIDDECPRILGVQAAACAPMVNAWSSGAAALDASHEPSAIIASDFVRVLRTRRPRDSYPSVRKTLLRVRGRLERVEDCEILGGLRLFYLDDYFREIYARSRVLVGLEAATALAGLVKAVEYGAITSNSRVIVNVSGAAKTGDIRKDWLRGLIDV